MSTADRPNILFVFSDQHRGDALGCAGNDDVQTPTFDAFAQSGSQLTRAYSNYPVCGPSRACLLTGQYPLTNGVVGNDLPLSPSAPSIGEAFGEVGYEMGYIGKYHLDGAPRDKFTPPGPRRQGFDDFWAAYNCAHDYFNTRYYRDSPDLIERPGYEPEVQTDLAIDFLDQVTTEPFCLFLSWGPPHDPYPLVPERYRDRYDPSTLSLPANAEPLVPGDGPRGASWRAPPIREWGPTTSQEFEAGERYNYDDPREILADYYAAITALDDQFARLLRGLEARGLREDTIIVYTSDHGDLLFSHGLSQKGPIYEESANIPFLIEGTGDIPAGVTNDTLFSMVDVAPTLLSLAGVEVPEAMEGQPLHRELRNPDRDGPSSVFFQAVDRYRGLRTERYTYAQLNTDRPEYAHIPGGHWLLFDNEEDPHQFRNRVWDPEYREEVSRLSSLLGEWMDNLDDAFETHEEAIERHGLEAADEAARAYFDDHFPPKEAYPE